PRKRGRETRERVCFNSQPAADRTRALQNQAARVRSAIKEARRRRAPRSRAHARRRKRRWLSPPRRERGSPRRRRRDETQTRAAHSLLEPGEHARVQPHVFARRTRVTVPAERLGKLAPRATRGVEADGLEQADDRPGPVQ